MKNKKAENDKGDLADRLKQNIAMHEIKTSVYGGYRKQDTFATLTATKNIQTICNPTQKNLNACNVCMHRLLSQIIYYLNLEQFLMENILLNGSELGLRQMLVASKI